MKKQLDINKMTHDEGFFWIVDQAKQLEIAVECYSGNVRSFVGELGIEWNYWDNEQRRTYFAQKMRESRQQAKRIKEEMSERIIEPTDRVEFEGTQDQLEEFNFLINELDRYEDLMPISTDLLKNFLMREDFDLGLYSHKIMYYLNSCEEQVCLFSKFPQIIEHKKRDGIFRFVALIFLQHRGEIELQQMGDWDLLVEKINLEDLV